MNGNSHGLLVLKIRGQINENDKINKDYSGFERSLKMQKNKHSK